MRVLKEGARRYPTAVVVSGLHVRRRCGAVANKDPLCMCTDDWADSTVRLVGGETAAGMRTVDGHGAAGMHTANGHGAAKGHAPSVPSEHGECRGAPGRGAPLPVLPPPPEPLRWRDVQHDVNGATMWRAAGRAERNWCGVIPGAAQPPRGGAEGAGPCPVGAGQRLGDKEDPSAVITAALFICPLLY